MKKLYLIVASYLLLTLFVQAQNPIYRSAAGGGNWTDISRWEKSTNNGSSWTSADSYPTDSNAEQITIRNGNNMTLNSISIDQVVIETGATLTIVSGSLINGTGNDLTVNGTLIISSQLSGDNNCNLVVNSGGILEFNGSNVYVGGVTIDNSGTSKLLDGKGLVFNGNLIFNNSGLFYSESTSGTNNVIYLNIYNAGGNQFNCISGSNFQKLGNGTTTVQVPFQNNGTLSLQNGTITFSNDVTGSGTFTQSNGTSLNFSSGFGTGINEFSEGTIFNGTGNLNISRTVNSLGTTNGITFGSGITLGLSGTLGGNGNLTFNGTLNWTSGIISGNGFRNFSNSATIEINTSGTVYLTGGTLENNGTLNFTNGNLSVSTGVLVDNKNTCNVTNNSTIFIEPAANCSFVNNGTFNINPGSGNTFTSFIQFKNDGTTNILSGNFQVRNDIYLNSGTINNSAGSLIFPSTVTIYRTTGTISHPPTFSSNINLEYNNSAPVTTGNEVPTDASTLNNFTVNGSGGVSLGSSIKINQNLTLSSGRLHLGNNNLTLVGSVLGTLNSNNMVITNGSGEFRKVYTTTGTFTFPIGDNTGTAEYSPVEFNLLSSSGFSSAYVAARVNNSKHSNNSSSSNYLNRFWVLNSSGISSPVYNATFSYTDSDIQGTETLIYGAKYNGTSWLVLDAVNASANTLTASNQNSFSDFTGGEQSALPVELISFGVKLSNNQVQLFWKTETEVNNYGFNIERKISEGNWEEIGFVRGHGNSNSPKEYTFEEKIYKSGKYFYRLKQIDNDGQYKHSNIIELFVEESNLILPKEFSLYNNYPNPFNPNTIISYSVPRTSKVKLTVYNSNGEVIRTLVDELKEAGNYHINFNATGLASGVYIYQLQADNFYSAKKMLLTK